MGVQPFNRRLFERVFARELTRELARLPQDVQAAGPIDHLHIDHLCVPPMTRRVGESQSQLARRAAQHVSQTVRDVALPPRPKGDM